MFPSSFSFLLADISHPQVPPSMQNAMRGTAPDHLAGIAENVIPTLLPHTETRGIIEVPAHRKNVTTDRGTPFPSKILQGSLCTYELVNNRNSPYTIGIVIQRQVWLIDELLALACRWVGVFQDKPFIVNSILPSKQNFCLYFDGFCAHYTSFYSR